MLPNVIDDQSNTCQIRLIFIGTQIHTANQLYILDCPRMIVMLYDFTSDF